jgi:hypothetical protein
VGGASHAIRGLRAEIFDGLLKFSAGKWYHQFDAEQVGSA